MVHISELILPRIRNHTKNQNLSFLNFEIKMSKFGQKTLGTAIATEWFLY